MMARDDFNEASARSMAREIFDESDGDKDAAVEKLIDRVVGNPRLIPTDQLRSLVRAWADLQIRQVLTAQRGEILGGARPGFAASLRAAAASELTRLMDTPLYGGQRLGSATAAEVRESADRYAKAASHHGRMARWQMAIATLAAETAEKPTATIAQTLDEATLAQLLEQADEK